MTTTSKFLAMLAFRRARYIASRGTKIQKMMYRTTVNPPTISPSTKMRRQIQDSTPVTAAIPPHTPAIHLSSFESRRRLTASEPLCRCARQQARLGRLVLSLGQRAGEQQAVQLFEFVGHGHGSPPVGQTSSSRRAGSSSASFIVTSASTASRPSMMRWSYDIAR